MPRNRNTLKKYSPKNLRNSKNTQRACLFCSKIITSLNKSAFNEIYKESILINLRDCYETNIEAGDLVCKRCINHANREYKRRNSCQIIEQANFNAESSEEEVQNNMESDECMISIIDSNNNDTAEINQNESNNLQEVFIKESVGTSIIVQYSRTNASHKWCLICENSNNYRKLKLIPIKARLDVFIRRRIMIPKNCRACNCHFNELNCFTPLCIDEIKVKTNKTRLTDSQVSELLDNFRFISRESALFDKFRAESSISNEMTHVLTGFSREGFLEIANSLISLRNSEARGGRTPTQALAIYLFWLKTNLDQTTIAYIFGGLSLTQFNISDYCEQVRHAFNRDFIPFNIGFFYFLFIHLYSYF